MVRNIAQMHSEIKRKIDFVNNARFDTVSIDKAINLAIEEFVNDRVDNIKVRQSKGYSVDSLQRVKDELSSLIVFDTVAPVSNVIAFPSDYKHAMTVKATIDGIEQSLNPATKDELDEFENNIFLEPTSEDPYYTEDNRGLIIHHDSPNAATAQSLTYVKHPDTVSIGFPREHIETGGTIVASSSYLVLKDGTIENGIEYIAGEIFSAGTTTLTKGKVVLRTDTTDCNLPGTSHKEVIDKAAKLLEGWIDEFQSKASLQQDEVSS